MAASHEPFGAPQKKKRLHVVLPHASDAPLLHHASHSPEEATLGCGPMDLTPPWALHVEAQNEVIRASIVRGLAGGASRLRDHPVGKARGAGGNGTSNRAARIVETMEKRGLVGPENGAKDREVLIDPM